MAHRIQALASQLSASAEKPRVEGVDSALTSGTVTVGAKNPDDVVIVSALRTAIGKARKGSFKDTTPDTLLRGILSATVERTGVKCVVVVTFVVVVCCRIQ